ncbi:hypothetical protein [Streptomyces sp. NPDC088400]
MLAETFDLTGLWAGDGRAMTWLDPIRPPATAPGVSGARHLF